jgi:hypothetical protein
VSRLAKEVCALFENKDIPPGSTDTLRVMNLVMKKLNIEEQYKKSIIIPIARRRSIQTSQETIGKVWQHWHKYSTPSTDTSRPAKLKVQDKPRIQSEVNFTDTVTMETTRNKKTAFYQSCWHIYKKTVRELYALYTYENVDNPVSFTTFWRLKPFYTRSANQRDIELCCCKDHLHARWAIQALLENTSKQNIQLDFNSYETFFEYLTRKCDNVSEGDKYINWACTPDKNTLCNDIHSQWTTLKNDLIAQNKPNVVTKFMHFEKKEVVSKKGKTYTLLQPISEVVNLDFLLEFIDKMLSKIIHHRNLLKNYRANISNVRNSFSGSVVNISVDFSENLDVKVSKEPQSLHWTNHQLTIHSGTMCNKNNYTDASEKGSSSFEKQYF